MEISLTSIEQLDQKIEFALMQKVVQHNKLVAQIEQLKQEIDAYRNLRNDLAVMQQVQFFNVKEEVKP